MSGTGYLDAFDDEAQMTPVRRQALLTIALGEFVDGYDLIVISGVLLQLQAHFGLSKGEVGSLSAAAFFGSAVGALFFGNLVDRIGRRRVFLFNLFAFVGLALASAAITAVWMLFVVRILVGVAIGVDIVASISFLSELSPRSSRGSWTGAMPQMAWSAGALTAILADAALYATIGHGAWRVMFALGAVPAIAVLLLRRSLPDSPRWLLSQGRAPEAIAALEQFGITVVAPEKLIAAPVAAAPTRGLRAYLDIFRGPAPGAAVFAIVMIGLTPLGGIGQSVLGPYVLQQFGHLSPVGSLLGGSVIWAGGVVGSGLAFWTSDRIGRMTSIVLSLTGFIVVYVLMVTVAYDTVVLIPLFGLLGVVTWFGSAAWWPLPSELLPTAIRGRAQGVGSALQRVCIGVNVYAVPSMLGDLGFRPTVLIAAGVSGALIPYAVWGRRYEPAGKSIEHSSGDASLPVAARAASEAAPVTS